MDSQPHVASTQPAPVHRTQPSRRRGLWVRLAVGVALIGLVAAGSYMARQRLQDVPTAASPTSERPAPRDAAIGLATLLPASEIRTLALPSGSTDARIAVLDVELGNQVKAGDVLARLDNEGRLQHAVRLAEATVNVRKAELDLARDRNQASIGEARAALAREEAAALVADQELERTRSLFNRNFVAKAALDQAEATASQARQRVEAASATLSRYVTGEGLPASVLEQGDIRLALSNLDQAERQLDASRQDLEQAYIRAPINGTIIAIHARAGEKPSGSGILELADTSHMIGRAEIYETSIASVVLGAKATLQSSALSDELQGTVSRIGLQVQRQSIIDKNPAANTDARVIEVDITLDGPSTVLAGRLIGLQALARIASGHASGNQTTQGGQ